MSVEWDSGLLTEAVRSYPPCRAIPPFTMYHTCMLIDACWSSAGTHVGKVLVAMGCHSSNFALQQEQAAEEQAASAPRGAAASPRASPNLTFRRAGQSHDRVFTWRP